MTSIALVAILFFAARLAIRIGIVLLIIWGVIRLIDRWRTPVAVAAVPSAAVSAPVQATTVAVDAAPNETEVVTTDTSDTKEVR